jgi:multicomponent Na+:H+ antiporter subunit B
MPFLLLFSVYMLLRGHNEPGGGFIGGLIASSPFILRNLAGRHGLPFAPAPFISFGLLLALASGVPALFQGDPYLTAMWGPGVILPPAGEVKLGTVLVFDIGVYFTVFGSSLLAFLSLSRAD